MSLIPVHGGLDAPVNRTVPLSQRKAFLADAAGLPKVSVTDADLATVYRIADGTLSPMTGPMTEAILLGTIAIRIPDTKLEWDHQRMRFTNSPAANALIRREYRDGWHLRL